MPLGGIILLTVTRYSRAGAPGSMTSELKFSRFQCKASGSVGFSKGGVLSAVKKDHIGVGQRRAIECHGALHIDSGGHIRQTSAASAQ